MANQKTLWKTLRNVRIASKTGHIVVIEAGKPRELPPELHEEAYACGCIPSDIAAAEPLTEGPKNVDRDAAIKVALEEMIAKNDGDLFTAQGQPRVQVVSQLAGFEATRDEITPVFEELSAVEGSDEDPEGDEE